MLQNAKYRVNQFTKGDLENERHVLGQHTLEFRKFFLFSFSWVLSHAPNYAVQLMVDMNIKNEPMPSEKNIDERNRWDKKMDLKKYMSKLRCVQSWVDVYTKTKGQCAVAGRGGEGVLHKYFQ